MNEASVEDGVPVTGGWFVINARDTQWLHNSLQSVCRFGGEGDAHFDDLGVSLFWLQPEQAMAVYHHEAGQEDFLVLIGECTLLIEGEERPLQEWDFVHCPPRTGHTIVARDRPALVLGVGARKEKGTARYPVQAVAIAHGAGIPDASTTAAEVYASFGEPTPGPAPEIFSNRGDILPL